MLNLICFDFNSNFISTKYSLFNFLILTFLCFFKFYKSVIYFFWEFQLCWPTAPLSCSYSSVKKIASTSSFTSFEFGFTFYSFTKLHLAIILKTVRVFQIANNFLHTIRFYLKIQFFELALNDLGRFYQKYGKYIK